MGLDSSYSQVSYDHYCCNLIGNLGFNPVGTRYSNNIRHRTVLDNNCCFSHFDSKLRKGLNTNYIHPIYIVHHVLPFLLIAF